MFAPERLHERLTDGNVLVTVTPPKITGFQSSSLILNPDQFHRYIQAIQGHTPIQDALPELSDGEREILLSGIGSEEWDREFGDDEH